jgi:carboxymethylenebutenolidase
MQSSDLSRPAVQTSERQLGSGISVYVARPASEAAIVGGLVLIQEIFGVNDHIRALSRHYAEEGFVVWAPSYYDRFEKNLRLGYEGADREKGIAAMKSTSFEQAVADTAVAVSELRHTLPEARNRIGSMGFCWGGSLAWVLASTKSAESERTADCLVDAAVGYYGSKTWELRHAVPLCPVMLHFGEKDASIPVEKVHEIQKSHPDLPIFTYDAGHGFNCETRKDYNPEAARLAQARTIEFLKAALV